MVPTAPAVPPTPSSVQKLIRTAEWADRSRSVDRNVLVTEHLRRNVITDDQVNFENENWNNKRNAFEIRPTKIPCSVIIVIARKDGKQFRVNIRTQCNYSDKNFDNFCEDFDEPRETKVLFSASSSRAIHFSLHRSTHKDHLGSPSRPCSGWSPCISIKKTGW